MQLGFASMNTPEAIAPDELARSLEARGFESLWIGEHTHIPVSRATPYPAGGELPSPYLRMMDPYLSLMLAASATTSLRIGTGVALPLEHDLLALAKTVATLDRHSGGRFQFGVGVGWNREELANHRSLPWHLRYQALEESVAALRALWCEEESEHHGRFFDFDPVWSFPKPLQRPHPPILCGTGGKLGTLHTVRWADAWMPMDIALGNVEKKIAIFQRAAVEAGRPGIPVTLVAFGNPSFETLQHYRALGVQRTILGVSHELWDDPAKTLPFLDRCARWIQELR